MESSELYCSTTCDDADSIQVQSNNQQQKFWHQNLFIVLASFTDHELGTTYILSVYSLFPAAVSLHKLYYRTLTALATTQT